MNCISKGINHIWLPGNRPDRDLVWDFLDSEIKIGVSLQVSWTLSDVNLEELRFAFELLPSSGSMQLGCGIRTASGMFPYLVRNDLKTRSVRQFTVLWDESSRGSSLACDSMWRFYRETKSTLSAWVTLTTTPASRNHFLYWCLPSPSPLQQRNPAESRSSFLFGTIYDLSEADSLWSCMFIWSNRKTTLVSRVWTGVMPLQLWFARIKRWACFMTFLHTRELLMLGETLCPYLRLSMPCLPVPYFYLISLPSWDFLSVPFALPSIDMVELQFPGFEFSLGCLSSCRHYINLWASD